MRRLMMQTEHYLMATPPSIQRRRQRNQTYMETKQEILDNAALLQTPMFTSQRSTRATDLRTAAGSLLYATPKLDSFNYRSSMNENDLLDKILTRRKARRGGTGGTGATGATGV